MTNINIRYGRTAHTHLRVLSNVRREKKLNPQYRVVDIGGVAGGSWTKDVADLTVDINSPTLPIDICKREEWDVLLDDVQKNGRYDYAICTHTLEDIYNPFTTLDLLPLVAKAGIITMPSIRSELSRVESASWLGYIHHRWIFSQRDGMMLVIPKLSMLERLVGNSVQFDKEQEEVIYEWTGTVPYKIFMNNYLGPDAMTVINEFKSVINI